MSGEIQLNSDGSRLLADDGGLAIDPDCCCGAQDVRVEGDQTASPIPVIANEDVTPSLADWTRFGIGVTSRTFTVRNTGAATLVIGGLGLTSVSGPLAFSVGANFGAPSIAPGGTTTFRIDFTGTGPHHAAYVWFTTNVTGKESYYFVVDGCVNCGCPPQDDFTVAGACAEFMGTYTFVSVAASGPTGEVGHTRTGPTWRWDQSGGPYRIYIHLDEGTGTWDVMLTTAAGYAEYGPTSPGIGCNATTGKIWSNDPGWTC